MIRFSNALRDAKLLSVFNPKKATINHTTILTIVELLKTEIISALSSIKSETTKKIPAEKRLAMRKRGGSIVYFPPHAACPYGNPSANNI